MFLKRLKKRGCKGKRDEMEPANSNIHNNILKTSMTNKVIESSTKSISMEDSNSIDDKLHSLTDETAKAGTSAPKCISVADYISAAENEEIKKETEEVNYDVNPTLLYKFIEYSDWNEALARIEDAPKETETWVYRLEDYNTFDLDENKEKTSKDLNVRWRMLPIHAATIFHAPVEVIAALQKVYPESINHYDDRRMLPIHLACRVVSNNDVVQFFIHKNIDNLDELDYKGRTPLDILMEYHHKNLNAKDGVDTNEKKNRESLIQIVKEKMVETKKGATKIMAITQKNDIKENQEKDYDKYPTVLIKLIERNMWGQAIARCVQVPQEASTWICRLQQIDDHNNSKKEIRWKILPIHSAIVLHAPVEVIKALVEAYPKALEKGDDRQMLPLHMAFRLGSSPEIAAVLVDTFPDALRKRDSKGHTPLQILKAYRRKYMNDKAKGKKTNSNFDVNRKKLIKIYLRGRKYGYSADQSEDGFTVFDYDSDSDSSSDEDTYYSDDDEDALFYKEMFDDFAKLTSKGLSSLPLFMIDTLTCRGGSYDLGED